MEEWVPVIFHPGEPDSAIAESARERAWEDFVVRGREPAVAPVVRDSWVRSRDVFQIDPALKRSPIVLSEDEWCRRRERLEPLSAGIPVLERFGEDLRETQDMLALCDADGYVLATGGILGSSRRPPRSTCASAAVGTSRPPGRTESARPWRRDEPSRSSGRSTTSGPGSDGSAPGHRSAIPSPARRSA